MAAQCIASLGSGQHLTKCIAEGHMSQGWTVHNMPRQDGRRAIITGGNSGIGYEAALELARHGAAVVLACRNPTKAEDAATRLRREVPTANVTVAALDLASLDSVRAFAAAEIANSKPLDLLLNNAGLMAPKQRRETSDGFELQFGTNVLGHFALTGLLLPKLQDRAQKVQATGGLVEGEHTPPRIVYLASIVHKAGKLHFDDPQSTHGYSPLGAYQQSKLADLMLSFELDRRLRATGSSILSVAAHPGIANTNLFLTEDHVGFERRVRQFMGNLFDRFLNSTAQGAIPTLFAATSPAADAGGYYGPQSFFEMRGGDAAPAKVASQARSEADAARLWTLCEDLTGVRYL